MKLYYVMILLYINSAHAFYVDPTWIVEDEEETLSCCDYIYNCVHEYYTCNKTNYRNIKNLCIDHNQHINIILALIINQKYPNNLSISDNMNIFIKEIKIAKTIPLNRDIEEFLKHKTKDNNFISIYEKIKTLNHQQLSDIANYMIINHRSLSPPYKCIETYINELMNNIINND